MIDDMANALLARLLCCFGSRRSGNASNGGTSQLAGSWQDSSTTTCTSPNEKATFKENQLEDKSPRAESQSKSNPAVVDTHTKSSPAMLETPPKSNPAMLETPSKSTTPEIDTQLHGKTSMIASQINSTSPMPSIQGPSPHRKHRTLILDLGDVLFHYAVHEITAVPPSTFKSMIKSPPWAALECGRETEASAIQRISSDLSIPLATIRSALSQCRSLLHVDHDLFSRLVALKREHGNLTVVAMTNISADDFARLKVLCPQWDELFDGEFTSFGAGMIKPDLGYYRHVIDSVGLGDPGEAVFVDDKLVNVDAARTFGIQGIVFEGPEGLIEQLRSQLMGSDLPLGVA